MRVAQVIGRVTLNVADPSFKGGRWLMCNPLDADQFNTACKTPRKIRATCTCNKSINSCTC